MTRQSVDPDMVKGAMDLFRESHEPKPSVLADPIVITPYRENADV